MFSLVGENFLSTVFCWYMWLEKIVIYEKVSYNVLKKIDEENFLFLLSLGTSALLIHTHIFLEGIPNAEICF